MSNLNSVYSADGLDALRCLYDDWAGSYDQDTRALGRMLPPVIAGFAGKHVPAGIRGPVLDVGCGTGIMGSILSTLGLGPVDGLDLSPGMLEVAWQKQVYRSLFEAALGPDKLQAPNNSYALIVAAGVFTVGHAGPEALDELVRVIRPGGVVIFSVTLPVLDDGFQAKLQRLSDHEKWRLIEATSPFDTVLNSDDSLKGRVFSYRAL